MTKIYKRFGDVAAAYSQTDANYEVGFGEITRGDGGQVTDVTEGIYVDLRGEEGRKVTVQLDNHNVAMYQTTKKGTLIDKVRDLDVADKRARAWGNLTWEVGRKRQIVYILGVKFDLSGIINTDYTLRAACLLSGNSVRLLVKDENNLFFILDVNLQKAKITSSQSIGITKYQLYSSFLSPNKLVTIELQDETTKIQTSTYNAKSKSWGEPVTEDTLTTIQAVSNIDYRRKLPILSVLLGNVSYLDATLFNTTQSTILKVTDDTVLSGHRIVACNAEGNKLGILIEEVDTTCNKVINRPNYAISEFMLQYFHPLFALGFRVGQAYDWRLSTGAYDSGKLKETWLRHTKPKFKRIVYTFKSNVPAEKIEDAPFDGGTFDSESFFYERYANKAYSASFINSFTPVPMSDIIIGLKATEYSENKFRYYRYWDNAIKFYCADPLNDVYVFQRANGKAELDFLNYTSNPTLQPDAGDLAGLHNIEGTMELVIRNRGTEEVILTRPISEEIGTRVSDRRDLNFEPTMTYYTQEQPPQVGNVDWTHNETKSINKSIDIAFTGRYIAYDDEKVGIAIDLTDAFDIPDFDIPNLSDDARYNYYTEGSIAFATGTNLSLRYFSDTWRPCAKKNESVDLNAEFDPLAPLDLDLRIFEDKHRLTCNHSQYSSEIELPKYSIPPEWPDIRGWGDFRRRSGFKNWTEAKVNYCVTKSKVRQSETNDSPPMTVMQEL